MLTSIKQRSGAIAATVTGIMLLTATGCQKKVAATTKPNPPEVFISTPITQSITDYEEATGRLAPVKMVELRARVGGYLDKVEFTDGQDVDEGTPLFQVDARPFSAAVAQAKATVLQLESRYERANRQQQRLNRLAEQKVTTAEELDLIKFQLKETEAELQSARAAVDIADLNLEFTQIKSPIKGRISRRLVDPGNLVEADTTPLAVIISLDPIYAYFDIDERTVLQFRRMIAAGKLVSAEERAIPVEIALADEDEFTIKGSVNFVDNQLSATTGTLRLRADVENPKGLLAPGMFIRIKVPIGEPHDAILIPEEALGSDQGQRFVYILNGEDEVQYRRVKIGRLYNGLRVIESGVTTEDRVVVKGLQRVRIGVKVTAKPLESHQPEQTQPQTEPRSVLVSPVDEKAGSATKTKTAH